MDNKMFDLIRDRVAGVLKDRKYKLTEDKVTREEDGSRRALFVSEDRAIEIVWDASAKRYQLKTAAVADGEIDEESKIISTWLFDPQTHGEPDAKTIANDFEDSIREIYKKPMTKSQTKEAVKKMRSNNMEGFIRRFLTAFPQYQEVYDANVEHYGELLPDTFLQDSMVSYMMEMLRQKKNAQTKKLFELLNEAYENGDGDVRSAVSVTVLRNVMESEELTERAEGYMSPALLKNWKEMKKLLLKQSKSLPPIQ